MGTTMSPSVLIALIGLLYLLGFGGLSFLRRQGLSVRFALEGIALVLLAEVLVAASIPVHPLIFLIVLYLVTMRGRLLVDVANWMAQRGHSDRAFALFRLALRLGLDDVTRQIVLINRGVMELRCHNPEAAYVTLQEALAYSPMLPGAYYLAAGYYNLGLACRRTDRESEAIRHFNQAVDTLPGSIYAYGARQALKREERHSPPLSTGIDGAGGDECVDEGFKTRR
ncbi:MAG TPA: tetratricopeptide repeat protein [Chloroflexi bacterium]|nr:tetratricopeptide repeat protein [Chloroflexota bacterium]